MTFCGLAIGLLPSSAWLKLCPRAFRKANHSLRSCSTAQPRCSLLGQLQQEISVSERSLTRLTKSINTDLMVELEYCPNGALESVIPEGGHILL